MRATATGAAGGDSNAAEPAVGTPMMAWVNLLSIDALSVAPGRSALSASQAAAYSFTQSLRTELQPAGIRVLNIFPGPIDDERNRELLPPKVAPVALARAIVKALQDGVEDVYPGEVAQNWYTRWYNNLRGSGT
jgi:NAD(P)-dependent dehydrogenase (short-subunit alcohol dehydrogenase family)